MHRLDQGAAAFLTDGAALIGGLTADIGFDRIQLGDLPQGLLGKRRFRRDMDVVELAPRVCPTERQLQPAIRRCLHQTAEPGIAVDLKQSAEAFQMAGRMLRLAVLAVDIGGNRVTGSLPRPVVDRVAPEPSGLGAAIAGIEHGQCRVVSKHFGRGQNRAQHQLMQWGEPPAGTTDPIA